MLFAETNQSVTIEQARPEDGVSHRRDIVPLKPVRDGGADNTSDAGPGDDRRSDAEFGQCFEHADMCQTAHRSTPECKTDAACAKKIDYVVHTKIITRIINPMDLGVSEMLGGRGRAGMASPLREIGLMIVGRGHNSPN